MNSRPHFVSPFISRQHALKFAECYSYADECGVRLALRGAHDAQSALKAIYEVSRWKARNRNDWRLTCDGLDAWRALSLARDASNPASCRFAELTRLDGVGAPIASTILTFIDDRKFTIIDWRTWTALGGKRRTQYSWEHYRRYLSFCKVDARRLQLDLRTFDKALWVAGGKGRCWAR